MREWSVTGVLTCALPFCWFVKSIEVAEPSGVGPLLPRLAVGSTLVTWTAKVLVSLPPLGSLTVTWTVKAFGPDRKSVVEGEGVAVGGEVGAERWECETRE